MRGLVTLLPLASVAALASTAGGSTYGHSRLAALPAVLPPTRLAGPTAWSQDSLAARLRASSQLARAPRTTVVVGLRAGHPLPKTRGTRVLARIASLNAVEVSARPWAIRAIARSPDVRYVEAVERLRREDAPNDPFVTATNTAIGLPYEWNLPAVGGDQALSRFTGSPGILVGYVDSGVGAVPDLAGQVAESWWFASESADAADTDGHGTFVASIIASRVGDRFGLAGFCGLCRLVPFKDLTLTNVSVATAIAKLVQEHVRVINLSIGSREPSDVIYDAVVAAGQAGVLVVAASGNDGAASVSYPAAYLQPDGGVLGYGLSVGASDRWGAPVVWSNSGSALSLLAPGSFDSTCNWGVVGALPPIASEFDATDCATVFQDAQGDRYAYASGTSFAAPEVAGVAALVWSVNPSLRNYEVAAILERTATRPAEAGWTPTSGWGVLNAAAAVDAAAATLPPATTAQPSTNRTGVSGFSLSSLRLKGDLRSGGVVIATTAALFAGEPLALESAVCTVRVRGASLRTSVRIRGQTVACLWQNPRVGQLARGWVSIDARATDGGHRRTSRSFVVSPA